MSPESSLFYSGVIFASSLHGEFADAESKFEALLDKHEQLLYASEMSLKGNAIAVSLYIPDMTKFVPLNKRYAARFGLRPPVRVCVQLTTNDDIGMGVIAAPTGTKIINVHVQSFSTWAPANIGPYSQANMLKSSGIICLAGQIGLDPAFMDFRKASPQLPTAQQLDQMACDQLC